ncbi:hypothetical protein [Lysinibacillus sphaericus]|uniref:hypothetical protein n=1 Tax=Lysinibacillus sphaericus TaxID=1421 RepID=UPI003CFC55D1
MNQINSRFRFTFFSFILMTFLFFAFSTTDKAFAEYENTIQQSDGTIISFDTEEDYNTYVQSQNNINLLCATCNQTTQTKEKEVVHEKVFIDYHPLTPNWSNATSHTISSGTSYTVSSSITLEGYTFLASVTTNTGVASTIPTNGKLNRLAIYSDIKYTRWKNVVKNPIGTVINTYYTNHAQPINAPYILVKYK